MHNYLPIGQFPHSQEARQLSAGAWNDKSSTHVINSSQNPVHTYVIQATLGDDPQRVVYMVTALVPLSNVDLSRLRCKH